MADDTDDLLSKRNAARNRTPPAPGRGFGPVGSMNMEEAEEAYVRDYAATLPVDGRKEYRSGDGFIEGSVKETVEAGREKFAPLDSKKESRNLLILQQMERLNEARDGGLAMFQQLRSEPGREFRCQDLTTYYVEPEGKFLIAKDVRGNFEAFELSTIGNMLERQASQQRQQGGDLPRTPVKKLKGPTQAEANNLIANLKSRVALASQGKVYESIHKIEKEMRDKFVAAASIPETKTPAIGLDPDKGKVDMVMAIATYGREEGKNMVRELRGTGGEIEQHKLVYKVEGETFSRTHPDKTTFDYKADEIEQAVDVRQKELGAIDVWESKSPALDLQDRVAAEFTQDRELAPAPAVSEETLDELAALDGIEKAPAVELATTEETLAALDLLNDREEQARVLPDEQHEQQVEAAEQQPEPMTEEQWLEKSEQYAADLMVDQQGLKLDPARSEDGPELRDEPEQEMAMSRYEREKLAERQQAIDQLRDEPEGTVADGDYSEYLLKGDQLYERVHHAESEGWAIWDANDPSREFNSSHKMESEMMAAFGHPEAANFVASQDLAEPPTIEEADLDVSFAEDREPSIDLQQSTDQPEARYEPGEDYEFSALENIAMVEDQKREEAAFEQPDQPSEVEDLKAQNAELLEKIAALEAQQQPKNAPSSTAMEGFSEEMPAEAESVSTGVGQGKGELDHMEVAPLGDGHSPSRIEQRMEARKEEGLPSKEYVAAAKAEIAAASNAAAQSMSRGVGQSVQ